MILYDLICNTGLHQFEGWFGSSTDYDDQKKTGLLSCPVCGSEDVSKAVMAPNIGAKGNQAARPEAQQVSEESGSNNSTTRSEVPVQSNAIQVPEEYKELVSKVAKAQKELLSQSEWVGDAFSEEAKAMHYGDREQKQIHGTATPEELAELDEEGVDITPLPLPVTPPESQN